MDDDDDVHSGSDEAVDEDVHIVNSGNVRAPERKETAARINAARKPLYDMPLDEINDLYRSALTEAAPPTLAAAIGDPHRLLTAEMLSTALAEYGQLILRDAEIILHHQDVHSLFLQFLSQGLRPEQCSLALLVDMLLRLKPSCSNNLAARFSHFKDRFSVGLHDMILSHHSATSGATSHAVFSMLMEFFDAYMTCDYTSCIRFTPLYRSLLNVQLVAIQGKFALAQVAALAAGVCGVENFYQVPVSLLFSGMQRLQWLTLHRSALGATRLWQAAKKADAFYRLVVHKRTSITPPPMNGEEDLQSSHNQDESEEEKEKRYEEARLQRGNSLTARFMFLQASVTLDSKTDAARKVLRHCVDAWANVLVLHLASYPYGLAFGPLGTASKEVSNLCSYTKTAGDNRRQMNCDWRINHKHFMLELPTASIFQLESLLMQPVLQTALISLPKEESESGAHKKRPIRVRLPALVCIPTFGSGETSYACTNPIVLPMNALKQILDEAEFRLITDLMLMDMLHAIRE